MRRVDKSADVVRRARCLAAWGVGMLLVAASSLASAQQLPKKKEVLKKMTVANAYFMKQWPDPGKEIVTNKARPSHIWTRGVYYEGLMALYGLDPKKQYYDYAVDWSQKHNWGLRNGPTGRNADDQCAGQTYLDLYQIDPRPERIQKLKATIDNTVHSDKVEPAEKGIPHFKDVVISNVRVQNAKTAILAEGQPNSLLENMTLDNVTMTAETAGGISYAKDWIIKNVKITAKDDEPMAVQNSSQIKF